LKKATITEDSDVDMEEDNMIDAEKAED